jgi:O-antigen/teichoic acid export membrane protein
MLGSSVARKSVAFSAGTVIRMSLGFFTWLAAARLYPSSQVGQAAAAISAMMLCIEAGLLGIDIALIALLPEHRRRPAALLDTAFTLAAIAACTSSLVFVALSLAGFKALHLFAAHPVDGVLFVSLTVLGATWWMMDQAAVALRRSEHVLLRAIVAGAVTLAAVVAFGAAGMQTAGAILVAWVAAAVVACAIGFVQIRRATGGVRYRPRIVSPLWRRLTSVGLPNWAVSAADNAPGLILPIVAAEVISAHAAAYWYTVWMMAFASYMVALSFGLHLFAEISNEPSQLLRLSRQQLRSGLLFATVATVVLIAVGPLVLSILGHAYESHGATPLRIAALAAVPMVVTKSYLFTCRATRRIREGATAATVTGVAAVSLAVVGAKAFGLSGIAGAWLAVQLVAAGWAALRLRALLADTPPQVPVEEPEAVLRRTRAVPAGRR